MPPEMAGSQRMPARENDYMKNGTPEMIEGQQAFKNFKNAMKKIVTVPKSALPPSPYKKAPPKNTQKEAPEK